MFKGVETGQCVSDICENKMFRLHVAEKESCVPCEAVKVAHRGRAAIGGISAAERTR